MTHDLNFDWCTAIIIHHADMDGIASALVVQQWMDMYHPDKIMKFICVGAYGVDFKFDEMLKGQTKEVVVFVLDYSMETEQMQKLLDLIGPKRVIWIDHHLGAIEKYTNFMPMTTIPGVRVSTDLCGAELAYLYFKDKIPDIPALAGLMKEGYAGTELNYNMMKDKIPHTMRCVGNWDVHREPDGVDLRFKYWFDTYVKNIHGRIECFDEDGVIVLDRLFDFSSAEDYVEYINEKMVPAHDTVEALFANLIKSYGVEMKLPTSKFQDYEIISINAPLAISSNIFNSVRDKYEIGMIWYTKDHKKYSYSIFRLDKNPDRLINLNQIASSYGGGGHVGAAGFTLYEKPLF